MSYGPPEDQLNEQLHKTPTEGSYDLESVLTYLALHGELRDGDRRVMKLNGRRVPESHRNTIANWLERDDITRAPLGRFDEILVAAGMMLHDFEVWEAERYGATTYTGPEPTTDDSRDATLEEETHR